MEGLPWLVVLLMVAPEAVRTDRMQSVVVLVAVGVDSLAVVDNLLLLLEGLRGRLVAGLGRLVGLDMLFAAQDIS